MAGRLAAGNEDDITLARVAVLVLEKEEIVDAVVAQRRGLDDDAERAGEALLDHKVLLPTDLGTGGKSQLSSASSGSHQ